MLRGPLAPLRAQDVRLREQSLKLTLACLSYDFIGTSVDESTEDVGTVQVREGGTAPPGGGTASTIQARGAAFDDSVPEEGPHDRLR